MKNNTPKRKAPKTAWKPGESGNPGGRPKKGNTWADILEEVGEQIEKKSGKTFKSLVSKRLWVECVNGNVTAIKELMNRMDGMPKQNVGVEGSVTVLIDKSLEKKQ